MCDPGIGALLDRLRSSDAHTAWEEFLCQYSPVLYQTARAYTADADAAAVSIVYKGREVVGLVTSGGYGYRLKCSIALAYVRTDQAVPGTELEVEILGERRRAVVGREPLYDPDNTRLRA